MTELNREVGEIKTQVLGCTIVISCNAGDQTTVVAQTSMSAGSVGLTSQSP